MSTVDPAPKRVIRNRRRPTIAEHDALIGTFNKQMAEYGAQFKDRLARQRTRWLMACAVSFTLGLVAGFVTGLGG